MKTHTQKNLENKAQLLSPVSKLKGTEHKENDNNT